MPKTNGTAPPFTGFSSPNGTIVPDELFDVLMPQLTEAELRVLLYIVRRTFGFKKDSDTISLRQMVEGITTRDGRRLDGGAGVSKASAVRAVKGLLEKGAILKQNNRSAEKGDEATTYALRFFGTPVSHRETPPPVSERDTPVSHGETHNKQSKQQTVNTFRKAHAQSSDGKTDTPETPTDLSVSDQTVSHRSEDRAPTVNGGGKASAVPATTAVVPQEGLHGSSQHSAPSHVRTRVLADYTGSTDPSETATESGGAGYGGFREQAMRIREEVRRKQEHQEDKQPGSPLRLSEVLTRHQITVSAPATAVVSPKSSKRRGRPPLTEEERELRSLFQPFVAHMATKLHDEAKLASSLGRFVNDYLAAREKRPELSPDVMFGVGEEALSITQHYSPGIRSLATSTTLSGVKSKMSYWFEILEVKLGLKDDHLADTYPAGTPHQHP